MRKFLRVDPPLEKVRWNPYFSLQKVVVMHILVSCGICGSRFLNLKGSLIIVVYSLRFLQFYDKWCDIIFYDVFGINFVWSENGKRSVFTTADSGWRHNLIDGQDGHVRDVRKDVDDGNQGYRDHNGQRKISVKKKTKFNIVFMLQLVDCHSHITISLSSHAVPAVSSLGKCL